MENKKRQLLSIPKLKFFRITHHASRITSRREEGFTLLETLVALSILGIALVVVFQLFSANMHSLAASEDYVAAVTRAESLMREILDDDELEESAWSMQTEDGYLVDAAVERSDEARTESLDVQLLTVRLTVRWQKGPRQRSLTLTTMKMMDKKI